MVAVVGMAGAGCASAPSGLERISAEANDLGISTVEIQHEVVKGDAVLTIRGLDDHDQELTVATLRTGMVLYTSEPDVIAESWSLGTQLDLAVGEATYTSVTPDLAPHQITQLAPALATFVGLSRVAREIDGEAQIRFAPPVVTNERTYAASSCHDRLFPSNVAAALQCCEDVDVNGATFTWHKIGAAGANYQKLSNRTYGLACRDSSGGIGCTTNCAYGPCGARNLGVTGDNTAVVFVPNLTNRICGYEASTVNSLSILDYDPEHYDGSQFIYAGVTGACTFTQCDSHGNAF